MVVLFLALHTAIPVHISLGVHLGPVKDTVVFEDGDFVVPSEGIPASFSRGEAILVQAEECRYGQPVAVVNGPVEFAIDISDACPEPLKGGQAGWKQLTECFILQSDG